MALNYTTKYSPLIADRFKQQSFTEKYAGGKYDFDGAQSIVVYTVDKAQLGDYNRAAAGSRFGAVSELGDTKQILTMTQDKSFTFSIDHGNSADQVNVKHCNEQLKSNWDEVCTPIIDTYRFKKWCDGAGLTKTGAALTKESVAEAIMSASAAMSNLLVPRANRVIFVSESVYILTKLSSEVVGIDTLGKEAIQNGVIGRLDGMDVVAVPDVYLPEGVAFLIKHKDATADPMKLKTMRVQKNPVGIDGDVGECRFYHDSFVLDSKVEGIFAYSTNGAVSPVITIAGANATVTSTTSGAVIRYTTDGSNPKTSESAQVYSSAVALTSGQTIRAYASKAGILNSGITAAKRA
ncbi:MAG: chitobiase/beta-hexosaminidase C-terminal domain-containing protein [Oscillospiraceae bacterium]|jgi:hypothetical protein|nr:chitobiase/beta-hexosaminidase C-terminal domain-containing protein [Oscillospiraceae bacterium]